MLACVPAVAGHIDSAAEREAVVDDHDFLMMGRARRMGAIELHVNARMAHPLENRQQRRTSKQSFQRAEIPPQQEHVESGILLDQPVNERAHIARSFVPIGSSIQNDACVEIPADQHDPPASFQHSGAREAEVLVGVHDHRRTGCTLDAPAIAVRLEHHGVMGGAWERGTRRDVR